ncbi:MAG: toll/interleukin-1 receptor domain-containing protein, partial [Candidatus Latescibacteria bacterium]|nr:toll/interleukin-1 receptor domain-containing protein [Candidatus Latescibacterota bacterium]
MRKCPVFICYRQVDGTKIAQWLFKNLHGKCLSDRGEVDTAEEVSSLDVYFDQTAPAVGDWKAIHQPRLHTSQAMIIVCTPGSFQRLEKNDWVHREIEWWLKNRKVAPILIDATGEGERW